MCFPSLIISPPGLSLCDHYFNIPAELEQIYSGRPCIFAVVLPSAIYHCRNDHLPSLHLTLSPSVRLRLRVQRSSGKVMCLARGGCCLVSAPALSVRQARVRFSSSTQPSAQQAIITSQMEKILSSGETPCIDEQQK
jgi:hypothetical protein